MTLRTKLLLIAVTAAVAFGIIISASLMVSQQMAAQMQRVQLDYLPKVALGPNLERQSERLSRAFQDAVAARDLEALAATRTVKDAFISQLASPALDPGQAAVLRAAVQDYHATAYDVSRRLINGETGEDLVSAMTDMQDRQRHVVELIDQATSFEPAELTAAFAAAAAAQATGTLVRLWVAVGCTLIVMLMLWWVSRSVLRSVSDLTTGLDRFGTGSFDTHVALTGNDELTQVARRANQMADNLKALAALRERADWVRAGHAGLVAALAGAVSPEDVAVAGAAFLARYVKAVAGALYYRVDDHGLKLLGTYAASGAQTHLAEGEGLHGEVARRGELMVVQNLPERYLRVRSAIGEASPRALVLLPLNHAGKLKGVLELALLEPWSELSGELLESAGVRLTVALEVALARAQTDALLLETQAQAARLLAQEDLLRSNNEELQSQQEELKQSNEELTHQADELEVQRRMLEERNSELELARGGLERQARELTTVSAYKSQFLTNMSHELRTPLNSMLLLSSLLVDNEGGNLSAKQVEFCRTINAAGRDLLALINQVLDLAKIEAGKQELHIESVPIVELTERARRVFEPLAKEKGLGFSVEVEPGVAPALSTDRQRVDQILTNLLANAIKFTEKGSVQLRASPEGERVVFEVSDTGVGISAEDRARLFVPFEQLAAQGEGRGEGKYPGTGLGLSIARQLAELLGGWLQLRGSKPGEGSTFVLTLPLAGPAARPSRQVPAPVEAPVPSASSGARRALLLIEDDRPFAEVFGGIIRAQGFEFFHASDATSGLALAKSLKPAGILLDLHLPDLDGFQVIERLREDPKTAHIPVHIVSALPAGELGLKLGAVGYLTKPASRGELKAAVDSLVAVTGQGRILVVEDDADAGESVVELLEDEGISAVRVADGGQALAALERERFAGMILDLSLPDMDGLELLERSRRRDPNATPPVVIYTGRALTRVEAQRLEAYTDAIVLKEGSSVERVISEVRLFVRRLEQGLGHKALAPAVPKVKLEGRRVLVVDDDMRTVFALSAMLRARGAEVVAADNGRVALETLAKGRPFDAVLMDVMMPEMDGYEAMRRIRADERFRDLPVVALTAKAMKDDEQKCLDAGATAYLPKPIEAERLFPVLERVLAH